MATVKKPLRRPRQLEFATRSYAELRRVEHGSDLRVGKRKLRRPYDAKKPLHLVMRSGRAKGAWSFRACSHERFVRDVAFREAGRRKIRIYQFANSGNHLHLIVHATDRDQLRHFLATVTGLIARKVTGARRGVAVFRDPSLPASAADPIRPFWDGLTYSRIVEWGRALRTAVDYVLMNDLEGTMGFAHLSSRVREKSRSRGG